jgi:hypothetical protein
VLKIKKLELCWIHGSRKIWSDSKSAGLEDYLNSFVIGLIKAASAKKADRLEEERRERERQEEHRRYMERERRRWEEERRFQALEKQITAWCKSRQIRSYLQAVREHTIQKHGQISPGSKLDQWLTWVGQIADRFDPILNGQLIKDCDSNQAEGL